MSTTQKNYKSKLSACCIAFTAFALSTSPLHSAPDDVRITRNEDGSHSEISTSKDKRRITRRTYGKTQGGNGEKKLQMVVFYKKDAQGRLRSGTIHNHEGKMIYRVVYGYHRTSGKLVKEYMYDVQVKRTRVQTGADGKPEEVEFPVRMLNHRYDAQGREMKAICICLPAGQTAEELFGKGKSSHLDRIK
ncbi:hypothetical protein OAI07_02260 [Akkermansiaceae bacterium]|nr:hypothetical protein [Akkermansiaceae bacterium]